MEWAILGLALALAVSLGLAYFWRRQPAAPAAPPAPPDPVVQLRQEIEAGRQTLAGLRQARQSLQAGLRGPAAEPEYISAAAELLATRLGIALEAYQVDGMILRVAERLRRLEEEMTQRPQLPPPAQPPAQDA